MPAKLLNSGRTNPPSGNENQPVSRIDCANATSPRTFSAFPSSTKSCASTSMGTDARYGERVLRLKNAASCGPLSRDGPMTGCPLRSTAPARAERVAAGTATTAATTRTAARRARDARRGSVMTRGDIDPFDDRLERAAATVAPADEPKQ